MCVVELTTKNIWFRQAVTAAPGFHADVWFKTEGPGEFPFLYLVVENRNEDTDGWQTGDSGILELPLAANTQWRLMRVKVLYG